MIGGILGGLLINVCFVLTPAYYHETLIVESGLDSVWLNPIGIVGKESDTSRDFNSLLPDQLA